MSGEYPDEDMPALNEEFRQAVAHLEALIRRLRKAGGGGADETVAIAKRILTLRRLRETILGEEFFSDPAWDMLLDLYVQTRGDAPVAVSSLCLAAGVPATTGLRWIRNMVAAGLLVRRKDPHDARRVFVSFGPGAEESMHVFLVRAQAEMRALLCPEGADRKPRA
ncbi:MAG TPA: MarR family winged helix-turn-helix transcriptional regulator [Allosphingosinicella sp.]|jgi:DNA-binding MarR family transcriptional regulator